MQYISLYQDQQIRTSMRECGQLAKQLAMGRFAVHQKGPEDYVTDVDRTLNNHLLKTFGYLFPDDGIIAEENTESWQAYHSNHRRLWCIDPVDGTDDFIHGKPHYAVMVGLLSNHIPLAGWIYEPVVDRMYFGGKDWGLFQTIGDALTQPLPIIKAPNPTAQFCPMILGYKDRINFGDAIKKLIPGVQFYSIGSFGLKVLEVIQGRAGLYVYLNGRVKLWDTTGPLALAQAAGLVCCDLNGAPLRWTPDAIDPDNLAHLQPIAIGWPNYIDACLDKIVVAMNNYT